MKRNTWQLCVGVAVAALALGFGTADAEGAEATPTFAGDVAPILYDNCVSCHRAGESAPMSLISYEDARPWSRSIKNKVLTGEMPPWHANPAVGTFSNARGLTDAEKDTIVRWVDAGAPEGDASVLPPAPRFSDGWQIGTPDVVIEMPEAFEVPAEGTVDYQFVAADSNFTEDRWVRAIELRAGARPVVHHILLYVRDPSGARSVSAFKDLPASPEAEAAIERARERARKRAAEGGERQGREESRGPGRLVASLAPGTNAMVFEADTALRIPKGAQFVFQLHYTAIGTVTKDQSRVGLIFADAAPEREMIAGQFLNPYFEIPPGESNQQVDSLIEFTDEAQIFALLPHTHLRGKRWEYEIRYPDGRTEPLLSVPGYDFNWQTYYVFEEPLVVPKGTQIFASAWYDDSEANKANPDATTAVRWGEQTWEEMQYTGITYSVAASTPSETTEQQP